MTISVDTVRIVSRGEIDAALPQVDVVAAMERAFAAHARGAARLPPVGEIRFDDPPGEVHIKSGHVAGDDLFVVKVATGFYENAAQGLPSSSGLMAVFDARNGQPRAILLDGGSLTDIRTAAAGAVAAKYLAPRAVTGIGILGSGIQARLQAQYLMRVTDCRRLTVWARRAEGAAACARDLEALGFEVTVAATPEAVVAVSDLIVTTTASEAPLLNAADLRPGTHVTAIGADSDGKQELETDIFAKADLVVTDALAQARVRGDISHALKAGTIVEARIVQLGDIVTGKAAARTSEAQITIADLTGVAVQDIEIAKAVLAVIEAGAS
ncbi:Alanine dehydrogenase [Alphaproteobacteria bacterium SO-S41]|nr:Alanine dehydrogenase [Alphaproteobacteria bacterium SO-S41]